MIFITLNIKDIIVFIVASEKPKILKLTSLQLIVSFCSSFNRSSLDKLVILLSNLQTKDSSSKIPFYIDLKGQDSDTWVYKIRLVDDL